MNCQHSHDDSGPDHGVGPFLSLPAFGFQRLAFLGAFAVCGLISGINAAFAQNYAIDWRTMDGGGGTSTGGVYAISGTIGQPDAGRMAGGPYALSGGFWSGVDVLQTPGLPALSIERLPGGAVRVFWTRPAEGVVLDEVGAITNSPVTGWTLVPPATYQTNATHVSITLSMPTGMRLFRLRQP